MKKAVYVCQVILFLERVLRGESVQCAHFTEGNATLTAHGPFDGAPPSIAFTPENGVTQYMMADQLETAANLLADCREFSAAGKVGA